VPTMQAVHRTGGPAATPSQTVGGRRLSIDDTFALYDAPLEVPNQEIRPATASHTMGPFLDAYVTQRISTSTIDRAVSDGMDIEVQGVYPTHASQLFKGATELVSPQAGRPEKLFNVIRPGYLLAPNTSAVAPSDNGNKLVVVVPPGRDYIMHNASLIRHYLASRGVSADRLKSIVRYPIAEDRIADWTRLGHVISAGDRVLIGYVNEIVQRFVGWGGRISDVHDDEFYTAIRIVIPGGKEVCALGVKFSYWGCIAGRLAAAVQAFGASELIYAGKLGALSSPDDVYSRTFVPSSFLVCSESMRLLRKDAAPPNGLVSMYPELDSGTHMSVATVLEEDHPQRRQASGYAVTTIDNEIAQIAQAITDRQRNRGMWFSAIHFATDYLWGPDETVDRTTPCLANNRTSQALRLKAEALETVAQLLFRYYREANLIDNL